MLPGRTENCPARGFRTTGAWAERAGLVPERDQVLELKRAQPCQTGRRRQRIRQITSIRIVIPAQAFGLAGQGIRVRHIPDANVDGEPHASGGHASDCQEDENEVALNDAHFLLHHTIDEHAKR